MPPLPDLYFIVVLLFLAVNGSIIAWFWFKFIKKDHYHWKNRNATRKPPAP